MYLRSTWGPIALALFLLSIPLANWMIGNVGIFCVPAGPCLVPVAPGVMAPSGVLMVGFALVLRDIVQRLMGGAWSLGAIFCGAVLSFWLAPASLVVASGVAFLLSELVDFAVYTPLQQRRFLLAVVASSIAGLFIDSIVFLWLAFGNLDYIVGQIVGKMWALLFAYPMVQLVRRVTAVSN